MHIRFKRACLAALLPLCTLPAWADGIESLSQFLRDTRSGQSSFTQTVTSPLRAGETVARRKVSSGRFEFLRPNRFRFHYTQPFEQTIVADGQTLWLHDVDLNQVTARAQDDVLGATPAGLIASASDLNALRTVFDLTALPERDGMTWVQALPKGRDAQLRSMTLGFKGHQLQVLDMLDSFGQHSSLRFADVQTNTPLKPEQFRFVPPPGADLIRQ